MNASTLIVGCRTCRAHARVVNSRAAEDGFALSIIPRRRTDKSTASRLWSRTLERLIFPRKRSFQQSDSRLLLRWNDIMIECEFHLPNCGV